MKPFSRVVAVLVVGAALAAPARAQLVHLSFTEPGNFLNFRANHVSIPWDQTGGMVTRLDVFYDVGQAVDLGEGSFSLPDPSRNFWRVNVDTHMLGSFEIIRPISSIYAANNTLAFTHLVTEGVYEYFDFTLIFSGPDQIGLPVPPFEFGEFLFSLAGGQSFFDVPNLAEGYGGGGFHERSAKVVSSPDLHPVPEPSTYAAGALLLLGAAIVRVRRRRVSAA